jgi:hypothetical protein
MAFILQTANGILAEASISMLGLGPTTPSPSGHAQLGGHVRSHGRRRLVGLHPAGGPHRPLHVLALPHQQRMDEIFNPKIRS